MNSRGYVGYTDGVRIRPAGLRRREQWRQEKKRSKTIESHRAPFSFSEPPQKTVRCC